MFVFLYINIYIYSYFLNEGSSMKLEVNKVNMKEHEFNINTVICEWSRTI